MRVLELPSCVAWNWGNCFWWGKKRFQSAKGLLLGDIRTAGVWVSTNTEFKRFLGKGENFLIKHYTLPQTVGPGIGLSFNSPVPMLLLSPFRTCSGVQSTRELCSFHQLSWFLPDIKIHAYLGPYIPCLNAWNISKSIPQQALGKTTNIFSKNIAADDHFCSLAARQTIECYGGTFLFLLEVSFF